MKNLILFSIIAILAFGCDTPADIAPEQYTITYTPICDTGSDCPRAVLVEFECEYSGTLQVELSFPNGVNACDSVAYRQGIDYAKRFKPDYSQIDTSNYYWTVITYIPAGTHFSAWVFMDTWDLPKNGDYTYFARWHHRFNKERGYKTDELYSDCKQ